MGFGRGLIWIQRVAIILLLCTCIFGIRCDEGDDNETCDKIQSDFEKVSLGTMKIELIVFN
jgi:hypothetical protein